MSSHVSCVCKSACHHLCNNICVCRCLASTSVQILRQAPDPPALTRATSLCGTSQNQPPYIAGAAAHHHLGEKETQLPHFYLLKAGSELRWTLFFPQSYCKLAPFSPKPPPAHLINFLSTAPAVVIYFLLKDLNEKLLKITFLWLRVFTFSLLTFLS